MTAERRTPEEIAADLRRTYEGLCSAINDKRVNLRVLPEAADLIEALAAERAPPVAAPVDGAAEGSFNDAMKDESFRRIMQLGEFAPQRVAAPVDVGAARKLADRLEWLAEQAHRLNAGFADHEELARALRNGLPTILTALRQSEQHRPDTGGPAIAQLPVTKDWLLEVNGRYLGDLTDADRETVAAVMGDGLLELEFDEAERRSKVSLTYEGASMFAAADTAAPEPKQMSAKDRAEMMVGAWVADGERASSLTGYVTAAIAAALRSASQPRDRGEPKAMPAEVGQPAPVGATLVEQLRHAAERAAVTSRWLTDSRWGPNYESQAKETTLEWKAADEIERLLTEKQEAGHD